MRQKESPLAGSLSRGLAWLSVDIELIEACSEGGGTTASPRVAPCGSQSFASRRYFGPWQGLRRWRDGWAVCTPLAVISNEG